MITTDPRFLLLFVLVFGVHWRLRAQRSRRVWLLLCSYAFYAAWDWRFLSLLLLSTGVDWLAALRLGATRDRRRRHAWLALSLVVNLGLLGVFKYLGFFVDTAAALLSRLGLEVSSPALSLVLPVGISFYTFQTLSYTLDVHAGRLRPRRSLLDVALYVAFFPQLVAGPIVRARDFLPQLDLRRALAQVQVRAALTLIATGFFKKACVADAVAPLVDAVFADPAAYDAAALRTASGLFAAQLYCDFSGYSDLAIGLAALLGYGLRENFRAPFLAAGVRDFWRRWHISLGTWIADYVFRPLCGTTPTRARLAGATLLSMLAVGLWHGAAWTFLLVGLLHGLAMVLEQLLERRGRAAGTAHTPVRLPDDERPAMQSQAVTAPSPSPFSSPSLSRAGTRLAARAAAIVATAAFVVATMVLFRAPDVSTAAAVIGGACGLAPTGDIGLGAAPVLLLALLAALHLLAASGRPARWTRALPDPVFALSAGATAAALLAFASGLAEPFLYFQF